MESDSVLCTFKWSMSHCVESDSTLCCNKLLVTSGCVLLPAIWLYIVNEPIAPDCCVLLLIIWLCLVSTAWNMSSWCVLSHAIWLCIGINLLNRSVVSAWNLTPDVSYWTQPESTLWAKCTEADCCLLLLVVMWLCVVHYCLEANVPVPDMEAVWCLGSKENGVSVGEGGEGGPGPPERGKEKKSVPNKGRNNMGEDEESHFSRTWWRRIGINRVSSLLSKLNFVNICI
jgi:hypothetical protein